MPQVLKFIAAVVICLCTQSITQAAADVAVPSDFPSIPGHQTTSADVMDLANAVNRLQLEPTVNTVMVKTAPADMPSYDPVVHFTGTRFRQQGRLFYELLLNRDYAYLFEKGVPGDAKFDMPLIAAYLMVVMDSGMAGSFWHDYYRQAARADAQAGDGSDPFSKRRQAVLRLANFYTHHLSLMTDRPTN